MRRCSSKGCGQRRDDGAARDAAATVLPPAEAGSQICRVAVRDVGVDRYGDRCHGDTRVYELHSCPQRNRRRRVRAEPQGSAIRRMSRSNSRSIPGKCI